MTDFQDRLVVALVSMTFTAVLMLGVFWVCYPEPKALYNGVMQCRSGYEQQTLGGYCE